MLTNLHAHITHADCEFCYIFRCVFHFFLNNMHIMWWIRGYNIFRSKFFTLLPTNRRVVQPVTWRDRPITAVIQLLFKLGSRIRDLDPFFRNVGYTFILSFCLLFNGRQQYLANFQESSLMSLWESGICGRQILKHKDGLCSERIFL